MKERRPPKNVFKPSEERIKRECAIFRESWSESERYKRAGLHRPKFYSIPIIGIDDPPVESIDV